MVKLTKRQKEVLEHLRVDRLHFETKDRRLFWINGGKPPSWRTICSLTDKGLVTLRKCGLPAPGLQGAANEIVLRD